MKIKELLKIIAWDILNPTLLKIKRKRKYKISEKYTGINIGCGIENPINWIGVDGGFTHYAIHKLPKSIYKLVFRSMNMSSNYSFIDYYKLSKNIKLIHHDLIYGLPFDDDSVPNIFSSHFLEHLFYNDAEFVINECYRVLKPNGLIRICIPSLSQSINSIESAINNYKSSNSDEIQEYVTSNIMGFNSSYSNHRYMYDWHRLSKLINSAGFSNVRKCDFKKGSIPNVEVLDTRDGLIIEAYK